MLDFLGTMTDKEKTQLSDWVNSHYTRLKSIQKFYKTRAAQLRRSSGLLNKVMADKGIKQTFEKDLYKAPEGGIRLVPDGDDLAPAQITYQIKDYFRTMLQTGDDSVFQMNNLCALIEKMEDQVFYTSITVQEVNSLLDQLDKLFNDPYYAPVLVSTSDTFNGEPRYRTDSLQPRTEYEKSVSPSLLGG